MYCTEYVLAVTLLCSFSKFAVQSKVGLQWLVQLGYSNIHQWNVLCTLLQMMFYIVQNAVQFQIIMYIMPRIAHIIPLTVRVHCTGSSLYGLNSWYLNWAGLR